MTKDVNPFETANAGFAQAVYEEFLRDPASVSPAWRQVFESGMVGERPATPAPVSGNGQAAPVGAVATTPGIEVKGPAARLVANMEESLSVPTATTFRQVGVGTLEARRVQLNAALAAQGTATKVSFTHLIGYAIVRAVATHPVMGHSYKVVNGTGYRVVPGHVQLGLAVDVERKDGSRGLVVPVLKEAETMDFAAFHRAYETLVEKARTSRLMPDDFAGATVTLTNPGGLGTSASVPRLMAGQGTIIAVGSIAYPPEFAHTPKETLAQLRIAKVMTVSSTYDHRMIQGAESGEFLRTLEGLLGGADGFYEGIAQALGVPLDGESERRRGGETALSPNAPPPLRPSALAHVAAGMFLVDNLRTHGHLAAHLDPLGSPPRGDPALDPATHGLTPEAMAAVPAEVLGLGVPGATLAEAWPRLQATYTGTIAYEVEHVSDHQERAWLRQVIESGAHRAPADPEDQRWLLQRLTQVEALERFLHKAYLGQKRFSIEGVDAMVPMLDVAIEMAAEAGAGDVVLGMAHRGRLNVLAHTVGRPYVALFSEFEGLHHTETSDEFGTGDVKYHLGAEGSYVTSSGRAITVSLAHNPSHLEFVGAVVAGRTRAEQTQRHGRIAVPDADRAIPIVIHGDAAFAGQGVVAETLNLGALPGYDVGGTIHLIANNQVGFTTDMGDSRSTVHASDLAKGFDVPIVHVNADDPEACLDAIRLAMMFRNRFHRDVLIDLVGYRRHGHNEGDEPAYTQPRMAAVIKDHPTVRARYATQVAGRGTLGPEETQALYERTYQGLLEEHQGLKASLASRGAVETPPRRSVTLPVPDTAIPAETLAALNEGLLAWPAGFTVHPKLQKQLERRRQVLGPEGGIEWAHAESLAFASLLSEGVPIRLTGQDTERGTFSQRHLVLHDAQTGATWAPIQHLPSAMASFELHNSPLSELATMGFEYGYANAAPEALVVWEAQFGDFVNGAQVILDQFVSAGQSKWGVTNRLTLLLPHGYEGQGPEHSSARIERFLQLAAQENMTVANCTTPAQYFHLIRRAAIRKRIRPLVVFTPKSLLRHPMATSSLADLAGGRFHKVLDDAWAAARADQIRRVVLCSGKVYYDLLPEAEAMGEHRPAIVRLEQLYAFPDQEVAAALARYPGLEEVVWAQEEPRNMGAWDYLDDRVAALLPPGVALRYAGRPERASPAEGYPAAHTAEQARLVRDALGT
ncbi:MAG TPA: multifunctional oxoglutarate decarboxylase/oxoglutarate dehydrogenase thiamine pyrophosphate-binding subunit/dihydrolipoyllysine-residue succinyltransferase subunit [Gemmatimonadales bacterium]